MRTFLTCCAAFAALALHAARVSLPSVVCNAGATLSVPVSIDTVAGLASAEVTVAYDPLVLVPKGVRPGDLADLFDLGISALEATGRTTVVCVAESDLTEARGGTLAYLDFEVRPGSELLYSDLALADVRLHERTMTLDLGADTAPAGGLLRPFAAEGDCVARMGTAPVTVAPGTTLRRLTLTEGDTVQVSPEACVTVTETLEGDVRLAPPEGGWRPGRYEVLRAPASLARAARTFDGLPECATLTRQTADGLEVYTLEVSDGTVLAQAADGTEYATVDAIPHGAEVALPVDSVLLADNVRLTTKAGSVPLAGADARSVADLLGGRFRATKAQADAPTALAYDYDLGIAGLEVRRNPDGNLEAVAVVALREWGQAPAERTLQGTVAEILLACEDGTVEAYPLSAPCFVPDGRRNAGVCQIPIPWSAFRMGTNSLRVRIRR